MARVRRGWLAMVLAVAAAAALFLLPVRDGRPLLDWRELAAPALEQLGLPAPERRVTAYRWRDEQGAWHYSTERPPPGTEYETVRVDPDANVLLPGPETDSGQ